MKKADKMYKINKYPDGTSYVIIPEEWEDSFQEITFKINTYEDFWNLVQLCEVLTWNNNEAIITIPCLLEAQADRRFNPFHSSTLKMITNILNQFGNISFKIFHPHNPEVVEALFTSVEIVDNSEFIKQVLYKLSEVGESSVEWGKNISKNMILMSSDAGGFKPLMKLCDKISWQGEIYSASKARLVSQFGSKLKQIVDREHFEGKDILIVDDISVYGGTFKALSKLLKERNCGKLYLAVSHMTVQNLGEDPVTNYFDKVFVTNSKYDNYFIFDEQGYDKVNGVQPKKLEIIKLF